MKKVTVVIAITTNLGFIGVVIREVIEESLLLLGIEESIAKEFQIEEHH